MSGSSGKQYWKAAAQGGGSAYRLRVLDEFPEALDLNAAPGAAGGTDRRSFLKMVGFVFGGAALTAATGCSRPGEKKAVPFLEQPEEVVPGRALWYASTCGGCSAGCGVLSKNMDGRPIKLEGNLQHPISRGGLCAAGQASILGLYDSQRLGGPAAGGREAKWAEVDAAITAQLGRIRAEGGAVRFLSGTITSPTLRRSIAEFLGGFGDGRHIVYDAMSSSAILDAHQRTHGVRALPRYRFERAEVIVSFDADFLGTWISPVEFTRGYRAGRMLEGSAPKMSQHVQVESRMSLTGSKADRRIVASPAESDALVAELARQLAQRAGREAPAATTAAAERSKGPAAGELAEKLWAHRGRCLVVSGSDRLATQVQVNFINELLGNYGQTLDLAAPSYQRQGDDAALRQLREEMAAGKVAALFIYGCNPAYDLPASWRLAEDMKKVPLLVSFSERLDETAGLAHFVCPDHHYLESWQDHEPVAGLVSVTQPAIQPLGQTRSAVESLAIWRGKPASAYELVQETWKQEVFKRQAEQKSFQRFWDDALQTGYAEVDSRAAAPRAFELPGPGDSSADPALPAGKLALVVYPTVGMLDGRNAHNPWLHELPDPITKVTWDNCASFSPATAQRLGLAEGDVVRLSSDQGVLDLPAHLQPGQHDEVVAVAMGYGRKGTDRFTKIGPQWLEARPTVERGGTVGRSAAVLLCDRREGQIRYSGTAVSVARTGRRHELACTQQHHSIDVPENLASARERRRPIVEETTLAEYARDPSAGGQSGEGGPSLWAADHKYPVHKWGMAIDMSACTGCSACVVSCQIENNVPVVGKDEVHRQREMHWLRIDRYYTSEGYDTDVAYQPMMCQQCDNAACETVCPVLATVHSSEGINQQVYNRCVGTRYCANNCAYKARRFNWFDYAHDDKLQNLVLNPDVTVRSRGVMEKCSYCIQRISEAKARARERGSPLADGDVKPACQQSCPAGAIVFGDLNDPNSAVSKAKAGPRHYRVLEELNVEPSVGYLRIVRNRAEKTEEGHV